MGGIEIAIVVYGLVFTVMLFLSIKQWRWFHIFMMFLLLCANVVLFAFAGRVLEVRHEWTKKYEENIAARAVAEEDLQILLYGTRPDGSIVSDTSIAESLNGVRHEYQRTLMGRGRVWRNANLTKMQLTPNIVDSIADITLVDAQHGVEVGNRFLIFREGPMSDAGGEPSPNVPVVYFGEYNVEAVNGAVITLKNVFAPTIYNPQVMVAGVQVSMYQKMPTDAHAPFAVKPKNKYTQQALSFEDNTDPIFGTMDPAHIDHVFDKVTNPLKQQLQRFDLSEMRERFKADGSPLAGREANSRNIWFKIRFMQNHTLNQKVNGDDIQANIVGSDFRAGEAVVPMLHHFSPSVVTYHPKTGSKKTLDERAAYTSVTLGGKSDSITFQEDEIIFIAAAEKIVQDTGIVPASILVTGAEGVDPVAEKLIEYYVRPVHNFTDIFHGYQSRVFSLNYTNDSALHDISRITESRNKASSQILFRKQEKKRLELDLELYRRDEVEAGEYAGLLSVEVGKLTTELAAIFQRNQGYAEKLAKDQAALEAEINAKTAAATGVNSEE
jgi:hypothetical protein